MNFFAGAGEEAEPGARARRARPRERRGQAAQRRRAHPLGSTRAGEGAGDGAMVAPPHARSPSSLSLRSLSVAVVLRRDEVERGESVEEERESKGRK